MVRTWSALRVMTADGFPLYEQSASHPGAFVVTCHSGVTLAANHVFDIAPAIVSGLLPRRGRGLRRREVPCSGGRLRGAGEAVGFSFEGTAMRARTGDSVAAALLANGVGVFRTTGVSGEPRGPYCMMGVCFECLVVIDGVGSRQACLVPVRDGMEIGRQTGRRGA